MTPETLRARREAAGLSQSALGARLGMTRQHVNRLENAKSPITATLAILLEYIIPARETLERGKTLFSMLP